MEKSDQRLLGTWFERCDPDREPSLEELDRWYVSLDAWSGRDGRERQLRGVNAEAGLVNHILLAANTPSARSTQLFSGFRGTGKSTELGRVARRLQAEGGFVVLRVNATDFRDMVSAPTREELAIVLGAGMLQEAAKAVELGVEQAAGGWGDRLYAALARVKIDVGVKPVEFGPFQIQAQLKEGSEFHRKLHDTARGRPDALRDFLHGLVAEVAMACHRQNAQLVLLVDGLEKFRVGANRAADVYQAMADLFFEEAVLLRLPGAHVVYTVPPYLTFLNPGVGHEYRGSATVLASVKIHDPPPDRGAYDEGMQALGELLGRRVDLDRLFGPLREPLTRRLAHASGGHVRDLLLLVRELLPACFSQGLPADERALDEAIRRMANTRSTLFKESRTLLEQVASSGSLRDLSRGDLGALATAMDQYLVLSYANGESWYDVHPLLWERFGIEEAE